MGSVPGEKAQTFLGSSGDARCWRLENRTVKAGGRRLLGLCSLNQNTVREPPLSDAYFQHWNICKSCVWGSPLEVENIVGHNKA